MDDSIFPDILCRTVFSSTLLKNTHEYDLQGVGSEARSHEALLKAIERSVRLKREKHKWEELENDKSRVEVRVALYRQVLQPGFAYP